MPLNKIQYTDDVTVIPADNLNNIQDSIIDLEEATSNLDTLETEVADIRVGADGTTYSSAGNAVRGQISDLGEQTILQPITLTDCYVDDGGFIGTRTNSIVYLYDITDFDLNVIKAQISGTHNRCRILLINDEISSVASGTYGTYIDKGNTTSEFSLSLDDLVSYKTLALCTNFQATPYADVVMTKVGAVNAYMRKYAVITKNSDIEFIDGYYVNYNNGEIIANAEYSYAKIPVGLWGGSTVTGRTAMTPNGQYGIVFTDIYDVFITGYRHTTANQYDYNYEVLIPENAKYFYISLQKARAYLFIAPTFTNDIIFDNLQNQKGLTKQLDIETDKAIVPELRNGSVGNGGNANAVCMKYIMPINKKYGSLYVEFNDSEDADKYVFPYSLFRNATDGMTSTAAYTDASITQKNVNDYWDDAAISQPYIRINVADMSDYDHIAIGIVRMSQDGTRIPIRTATEQYCLKMKWEAEVVDETARSELNSLNEKIKGFGLIEIDNARHIKGNSGTPLTLLHFSDVHNDTDALSRIVEDAEAYGTSIDEIICTGDMRANVYGEISSWWNSDVLTCIGNHDCASYDSLTGYNWTALSMADRDAYYIAPFESSWGITHTSGTSYYYKDYSASNVRLIVMDGMLYTDNGSEATVQTAWLENLLADAITNSLHVLIAIHAPHPDSVAKECSFSRYGQTAMPTNSDCNTPQVVVDTVAAKISTGLHFIGYLVGHTHQDNIWDAEGDGTQLMYCVTCAAITPTAQWINSDQHRSTELDAYNLVTIDTTNTLVKIVRGGGADIDDHMRTRKAICINYLNGAIVGEVL